MKLISGGIVFTGLILLSASFLHAVTAQVSGRQLRVNGQTFTVKGVNYSPVPVGSTLNGPGTNCAGPYHWWMDRPTYIADFPLIRHLGANTIRTFDLMNSTPTATQVRQALDAAQANGLYVVMGYFVSHSATVADASFRTQTLAEFSAAVSAYKDHPAVLMWAFGNENNLDNGNTNSAWYSLVQLAAAQAKALDPNHPVTTVEGECIGPDCALPPGDSFSFLKTIGNPALGADDATLSALDLWSINVYRGTGFAGVFEILATSTTKPVMVSEFGKDAWRDATAAENQDTQASYLSAQWQEITANLSATSAGAQNLIGGAVFEWTDEWWKDSTNDCATHGNKVMFTRTNDTVDPNYQDEWFGLNAIAPIDTFSNTQGTRRVQRKAFATLQSFWNPGALSAVASAPTSFFSDTVRNYPNPLQLGTAPTRFVAFVNDAGTLRISLYDASGELVTSLTPVTTTGPGRYELSWDGKNRSGEYVSAGLYYARIEGKSAVREDKQFRKVVAVK